MRRCEICKIILDDDVRHCPKCGKPVGEADGGPAPERIEVSALLTSANLHRIRGEWDEAVADVTEALKVQPDNADIASLPGYIYEQREMLDDAAIWYQMAVESDPNNAADRARLQRIKDRIAASGTDPFRTFQRRTRVWTLAMAGAFLLVIIAALLIGLYRSADKPVEETGEGLAMPQTYHVTPSPPAGPPAAKPEGQEGAKSVISSSLRTSAEAAIGREVTGSAAVAAAGATIDDVIADPREGAVTLTFSVPGRTGVTRSGIITAAAAVARAAFSANAEVKLVTARCVVTPGDSALTQVVFVGDVARDTMARVGDGADEQQLTDAFTNKWWNPRVSAPR